SLTQHTDDAFACAWADDGVHLATGAQDKKVLVWDARNWSTPVAVMESVVGHPRSLKFSPQGGGKRVLLVAEAADFVSVVDARDYEKRQVLDFFGAVAGVDWVGEGVGGEFVVGNADEKFGGLMHFERAGVDDTNQDDWVGETVLGWDAGKTRKSRTARERANIGLGEMVM
ncbi:hypothetical protein LTS18_010169, partial [Coniosporium uncinatum]